MEDVFLTALAQARPDPGGGAAAAYGARLALALAEKVALLELKRPRNGPEDQEFWDSRRREVQRLKGDLARLQEADVQAYAGLARARREGGDTLAAAVQTAIDVPGAIMEQAAQAVDLVAALGEHCRQHLVSDLQVAGELLAATLAGAFHMMTLAASVLANQSQGISMITAPHAEQSRFKHVELISTQERRCSWCWLWQEGRCVNKF